MNKRLKKIRKALCFTQKEMAEKLNISITEYSKIEESGDISCNMIKKIAEVLNVNVLKILYDSSEYNLLQKKSWFQKMINEYTSPYIFIREENNSLNWYDTEDK